MWPIFRPTRTGAEDAHAIATIHLSLPNFDCLSYDKWKGVSDSQPLRTESVQRSCWQPISTGVQR